MTRFHSPAAVLLGLFLVWCAGARAQELSVDPAQNTPAEPTGNYIVITALEADVLAIPAANGEVLLKGVKGDLFPLLGQRGEWYGVAVGDVAGWLKRDSAALMFYPEFLDPERLRESYTPPPAVPRVPWGYWGYPGYPAYRGYDPYTGWWGRGAPPYPWSDPLGWGLWLHELDRRHDHRDDHGGRDRHRDRPPDPYPGRPPPQRDPRLR